jgi:uncharacterized protein DUF1499
MPREARGDRRYPCPLPDVRRAAQQALAKLGWSWTTTSDGGFDAVWTSRVFKFKDDVTIRFHSAGGTLVRVQSTSRKGMFDFGQNARHVRDFFNQIASHFPRPGGEGPRRDPTQRAGRPDEASRNPRSRSTPL